MTNREDHDGSHGAHSDQLEAVGCNHNPLFGDPNLALYGAAGMLSPAPSEPAPQSYVGRHRARDL